MISCILILDKTSSPGPAHSDQPPQLPPGFLSGLRPAFEGLKQGEERGDFVGKCPKVRGDPKFYRCSYHALRRKMTIRFIRCKKVNCDAQIEEMI